MKPKKRHHLFGYMCVKNHLFNMRRLIVITVVVCTSLLFGRGSGQDPSSLSCFDCDPIQHPTNECTDPTKNAVPYVNCGQRFPQRSPNASLICVSANIMYYGKEINKTGIYRGCNVQNESVIDFCDWFKEEINDQNADLMSCDLCNTTRCNYLIYDETPNASDQISSFYPIKLAIILASFGFLLSNIF